MEFTSETVGLSVSIFAGGFLCTQFLSHVLTLDSVMTFLATIWMTFFTKDCLALVRFGTDKWVPFLFSLGPFGALLLVR